jgi:hypothetical protein
MEVNPSMFSAATKVRPEPPWSRFERCVSARRIIGWVPTIARFDGITITMYFDDHHPPHFHARTAEHSAKIRIDTLRVIASSLPGRDLRRILAWAELHQKALERNWRRVRDGIPPLCVVNSQQ